jgi:ABC-type sugar transport system ATPase subunit
VFENIAFPLRLRRTPREELGRRVAEVARRLGVFELLGRRPAELSGGQRQRVALGRALVRRPRVFLLDEPLSNLDAQLRAETRAEIKRLHAEFETTTLYVTHDQTEAMTLSDRIAVLKGGQLQQVGSPAEIYDAPANRFVAGFVGNPGMNFVPARLEAGRLRLPGWDVAPAFTGAAATRDVIAGFRPEDVALTAPEGSRGQVEEVESLGSDTLVVFSWNGARVTARGPAAFRARRGDALSFRIAEERLHLFDPETGRRLTAPF